MHGLWGSLWSVGFVVRGLVRGERSGVAWKDLGGPAGKGSGGFLLRNDLLVILCVILFVISMGLLKKVQLE